MDITNGCGRSFDKSVIVTNYYLFKLGKFFEEPNKRIKTLKHTKGSLDETKTTSFIEIGAFIS